MNYFYYKKLSPMAKAPTRGTEFSAGLDLFTVESVDIPPHQRATLRTGLAMSLPVGTFGSIRPRSKLAAKKGIDVLAGVVDNDYRGEVMISLLNTSDETAEFRAGDKVAQMIIQPYLDNIGKELDELDETGRGTKGINSSEMRLR